MIRHLDDDQGQDLAHGQGQAAEDIDVEAEAERRLITAQNVVLAQRLIRRTDGPGPLLGGHGPAPDKQQYSFKYDAFNSW